jgi:hypothetical protein
MISAAISSTVFMVGFFTGVFFFVGLGLYGMKKRQEEEDGEE